ncbi:hypothetical protein SAMN03159297_02209 [Pseudomonas sp. NFACC45]|nr:hypothetical protein SAMN03159297_02209 [Pseudomonas sp. NFACC45]
MVAGCTSTANPLWERACSRKRGVSLGDVECAAAFASKPAPTVFPEWLQDAHSPPIPCGSEPARESGVSVCGDVECAAAFASKPAPTVFSGWLQDWQSPQIPCGSEPARESGVSVWVMLNVPPSSRAGSLPQFFPGWLQDWQSPQIPCGSEPARESGVSVCGDVECAAVIASKPAPTLFRGGCRMRIHRRSPVGASLLAIAVVLFDDVDLAYVDVTRPGARRILRYEHRVAGIDRQVGAVGCLQGDAAFNQVHQLMQFVGPGLASVRR